MAEKKEVIIKVSLEGDAIADTEELSENMKDVKKESKETTETFGIMDTRLGKMATGIIAFGKKGVTAMKTLKGAIIATGIGALVIAVVSLISYFTKTERGAQKLRVIMAGLGQVVSGVVDVFIKIGETLGKIGKIIGKVVKGQTTFKEGWKETKEVVGGAVKDIGDGFKEMGDNIDRAIALEERENQLRVDRRENLVAEAKLLTELALIKQQMDDQTKTEQERIELLNEAIKLQNDISNERIRLAKEAYEITKEKNTLSESTEEDMEREAQLLADLILLEAERAERQKEFGDKKSALLKAEKDKRIALKEEEEKADEDFAAQMEKDLKAEEDRINKELELEQEAIEASLAAHTQAEKDKEQLRKEAHEAQIQREKEGLANTSNMLKEWAKIIGTESKHGKAIASAAALIDTYQGAQAAFSAMAGIPVVGPALGIAAAAAAVVAGLKTVQEINKVQVPKKALGGWIGGPSHLAGGTTFEGEGGEYIVNKRAMSNPAIAQSVINANSGMGGTSPSLTEERVAEIAAQVVRSVPVYNIESESTGLARTVQQRESRFIK